MIYLLQNNTALFGSTDQGTPLPDAISCEVTEQRNGAFCATMQHPFRTDAGAQIDVNTILMLRPRPGAANEPFRVYEIDQTIQGVLTARANHIAYDLDGRIALGGTATGITQAVANLNVWAGANFQIVNDGITDETTEFNIASPISVWAAIGRLAQTFGGELSYAWDDFYKRCTVTLHAARGVGKNTVISYGVNIISMTRKRSTGDMYSMVFAFWSDGENAQNTVWSSSHSTGETALNRTLLIDCSRDFETAPTQAQLNTIAERYIAQHDFTTLDELQVEYIPLEDTTEYKPLDVAIVGSAIVGQSRIGTAQNVGNTEQLDLCDIGTVDASFVGVAAKAKCVETVFDVLRERYTKTTIGTLQNTIVDAIVNLSLEVKK